MNEELKGRVLVACQFIIIGLLVSTTKWHFFNVVALGLYCGSFSVVARTLIVMVPGSFNIRPTLKKKAKLVSSGPYRYIRHPMYLGVILACAGLLATSADVWRISLLAGLVLVLYCKAIMEEKILLASFTEYQQLRERTGMFFPGI